MFFVYSVLNNLNGKVYIGYTKDPIKRWQKHIKVAYGNSNRERYFFHRAIAKYKKENFTFQAFQTFLNEEECKSAEIYWIKYFNSNDQKFGYNLTAGGEGCSNRIVSKETKEKIRLKAFNRKHSQKTKDLLRLINLNKIPTNIEQLKIINIGKKLSIEHKKKISLAKLGVSFSKEHRENLSKAHIGLMIGEKNPFYNRKHTEETKNQSRGENNKNSKLKSADVLDIRKKYNTENYSQQELADKYKVSRKQINRIVRGVDWKHLLGDINE